MLEDLVEVLDRAWDSLNAEKGVDFAMNCFPFHAMLVRETRTNLILQDLRQEETDSLAQLERAYHEVVASLREVFSRLERDAAQHFDPAPDDDYDHDASAEALRVKLASAALLKIQGPYGIGEEKPFNDDVSTLLEILRDVAKRAELKDEQAQLGAIGRRLKHANRTRRIFYRTSAAASLVHIERILSDLYTSPIVPDLQTGLAQWSRLKRDKLKELDDALFTGNPRDKSIAMYHLVDDIRVDMRRVYEDVRRRLGQERSLLAVFQRYRQRCQWYEADTLREMAAQSTRPEDRLAETLVTYLFDRGLNPLTQPMIGKIRPDALDAHSLLSFYLEAKQYHQPNRSYLLNGIWQVWDMLNQLRGTAQDVREAFYVVFRRSGPRYDFVPRIQHGDRVVHVLFIDISHVIERGSNSPPTYVFTTEDLLPRPAIERAAILERLAREDEAEAIAPAPNRAPKQDKKPDKDQPARKARDRGKRKDR